MERDLEEKQKAVDELKAIEKRKESLYARRQQLQEINIELQDDDILKFDDQQFYDFVQNQKAEQLRLAQEALEEEKRKLEEEKNKIAREQEIAQAKKEAEEKARQEAEEKAKRDAELAEQRHQAELQRIKTQAEAKEKAEKEAQERAVAEAQAKKEAEEKNQKYQDWLKAQNYNQETDIIQEIN
jgi:hypothetical protein